MLAEVSPDGSMNKIYVARLPSLGFLLLMGGCIAADLFPSNNIDYTFNELAQDAETNAYLHSILNERANNIELTSAKPEQARQQQEIYAKQMGQADLLRALRARGYYDAAIGVDEASQLSTIKYDINYGSRFTISETKVLPAEDFKFIQNHNLVPGAPLNALDVLAVQQDLEKSIKNDRCYFSLTIKNQVYLNRAQHNGEVNYIVMTGREGVFGKVEFTGSDSVKDVYLRTLVPWHEGDCFDRKKLESLKNQILQTGLFSRAEVILPEKPDSEGSVPVAVALQKRLQRTFSVGLTYYSDEGVGGTLGWEHRNLFGAAEKLQVTLNLSLLRQGLDLDFSKPQFMHKDQTLKMTSSLIRQDTDAFEDLEYNLGAALARQFTPHFSGNTGITLSATQIRDRALQNTKIFGLVSAPQSLFYDRRDDKLDSHKGFSVLVGMEPYFDVIGQNSPFFRTQLAGTGYQPISTSPDIVLAVRAGIDNIWGSSIDAIPATKRLYAGGDIVRGYGNQEIGPRRDGNPSGGLGRVNFATELRAKITPTIGAVAFVDGATLSHHAAPTLNNPAIGVGIGIRYYTSFGPIRFDIATPLTQKNNLERNYQFYISIGQAF